MASTRQADSQVSWLMLWSASTKTAVLLRIPITPSGQALTQALEPVHILVSMTGWRVKRSAIPDLTVSAKRAQ